MRYQFLGRNCGLKVSELALGVALFGTAWGYGADAAQARLVFDRFVEAGGNFFDTSDSYQFGQSETLLGESAQSMRDDVVIASKYSSGAASDASLAKTGNSRNSMI
ncbi:hypothetical protein CBA19CS42_35605 [Caballeronia novacaledonica]|uniref:NADP-dependent oxidoreductase domain-containing protein n=1 Tax=Caballeronia novacaledonica TaxID=1544861 RepID=A0AA37IIM2_9BURK|nr:hypothetical protein CBA19CS42_35605 [Caballeronia novacaledonica]